MMTISFEQLFQILSETYASGKLDGQPIYSKNYPEDIKNAMVDSCEEYLDEDSYLEFLIFLDEKFLTNRGV